MRLGIGHRTYAGSYPDGTGQMRHGFQKTLRGGAALIVEINELGAKRDDGDKVIAHLPYPFAPFRLRQGLSVALQGRIKCTFTGDERLHRIFTVVVRSNHGGEVTAHFIEAGAQLHRRLPGEDPAEDFKGAVE